MDYTNWEYNLIYLELLAMDIPWEIAPIKLRLYAQSAAFYAYLNRSGECPRLRWEKSQTFYNKNTRFKSLNDPSSDQLFPKKESAYKPGSV